MVHSVVTIRGPLTYGWRLESVDLGCWGSLAPTILSENHPTRIAITQQDRVSEPWRRASLEIVGRKQRRRSTNKRRLSNNQETIKENQPSRYPAHTPTNSPEPDLSLIRTNANITSKQPPTITCFRRRPEFQSGVGTRRGERENRCSVAGDILT